MNNQLKERIMKDLDTLFQGKEYEDTFLKDIADGCLSYLMVAYLQSAIQTDVKLFAKAQAEMIPSVMGHLKGIVDEIGHHVSIEKRERKRKEEL